MTHSGEWQTMGNDSQWRMTQWEMKDNWKITEHGE